MEISSQVDLGNRCEIRLGPTLKLLSLICRRMSWYHPYCALMALPHLHLQQN